MVYFWREKNATRCAGKARIVEPTREELEKELILKLEQKLNRIDAVFDAKAREECFWADKKPKKNLDGMSEKEIIRLLGKNLAVDFLQLCFDFADFYELSKNFKSKDEKVGIVDLKRKVETILENLKGGRKEDLKMQIENLFGCSRETASLCDASWESVESLQVEKEEEQGSFLHGKYVFFDEE